MAAPDPPPLPDPTPLQPVGLEPVPLEPTELPPIPPPLPPRIAGARPAGMPPPLPPSAGAEFYRQQREARLRSIAAAAAAAPPPLPPAKPAATLPDPVTGRPRMWPPPPGSEKSSATFPPPRPPPPLPPRRPTAAPAPPSVRAASAPVAPLPARTGSLLTPAELEQFKNLLVFARSQVEGYFTGKHKSPYRGYSAEFAEYKEYVPGDDVQHLDWRVYGRSRRLFIRQYEEETDMVVYLLVDASASMKYAGERRQPKFFLAAKIAAALAYLMLHQGDKAALALFAETMKEFVPPGGTRRHLHRIITALERAEPQSTTGFSRTLGECVPLFRKRGRLVILSDFLADRQELLDALGQFVHRKFEILLLQTVDPDELNLPAVNMARFVDLETAEQVEVEPEEIRARYQADMRQSIAELAREADQRQIQHALVDTREPYLSALEAYMGFRQNQTVRI